MTLYSSVTLSLRASPTKNSKTASYDLTFGIIIENDKGVPTIDKSVIYHLFKKDIMTSASLYDLKFGMMT